MVLALVDVYANSCMMLRAHQTPSTGELKLRNMTLVQHYIAVIKRYKKDLLKVTDIVVADAFFSTKTSMSGEDVLRTYIAKLIFDKCRRIPNRKLINHTIKELFG